MFGFLGFLIVASLANYGAVQPHIWLALAGFWTIGISYFGIRRVLDFKRLDLWVLLAVLLSLLMPNQAVLKFAVGILTVFWVTVAVRNKPKSVPAFYGFLVLVGLFEASYGLLQYFLGIGLISSLPDMPRVASGTLVNRNHLVGLLEMMIPVALGLAYFKWQRFHDIARSYVWLFCGAVMGLAVLITQSRSGIFAFLFTLLVLTILLQARKARRRLAFVFGFGLFTMVFAAILWVGIDSIFERYGALAEREVAVREGRLVTYRDTIRMIAANPWGIGIGEYEKRFRRFQTINLHLSYDHAHNDYLETAAEWGVAASVVFWLIVFYVWIRAVQAFLHADPSSGDLGILLGSIGAVLSLLIHSLTDFNLQIPSNAMVFFAILGVTVSYSRGKALPQRLT